MTTENLKNWQNSRTKNIFVTQHIFSVAQKQIVTFSVTQKDIVTTQKLKLWQLKTSKVYTTNFLQLNFWQHFKKVFLVRTIWHLNNRWDVLWGAFCNLAIFMVLMLIIAHAKKFCVSCIQNFFMYLCISSNKQVKCVTFSL